MRRPLRDFATVQYGKSPNDVVDRDGQIPVYGTGGVYRYATRGLFNGPAVVVARKGTLGQPHFVAEDFWASDTTYAVHPRPGVDARWLYYNLEHFDLTKLNEATGVPSINRDLLYRTPFREVDGSQQRRIADVLGTVDEAMERTEALIAKMQRIKSGLMQDLFTRGVTVAGRLRPPRSEAPELYQETKLGWLPRAWRLRSCSSVCSAVIDCKNRTPPVTVDGYPVIRTPNVRDGEFVWAGLVYTDADSYVEWTARGRPVPGDVVITREAPVGEVCMIPPTLPSPCLGQRMMLYRPNPDEILGNYLLYVLQSEPIKKYLDVISGGSTVGHVRVGDIRDLRVPWTDLEEQERIADRAAAVYGRVRALEAQRHKLLGLRSGLMADLLSGRTTVADSGVP